MKLAVVAATMLLAIPCVAWQPSAIVTVDPGPQSAHSMVYDEQLQRVVLITGNPGSAMPESAALWTWNGRQWDPLASPGLPSRYLSAAAYDAARKRLLVFGGRVGREGFTKGDTWEWDGATWRETPDTTVGIRDHHSLAYDERRRRTVLYGGSTPPPNVAPRDQKTRVYPADTWEWDGKTWELMTTEGPGSRNGSAMAYDARRGRVVLFGGMTVDRVYQPGTWTWDGRAWTEIATGGPPLRATHRMVYDSGAGVVLLYGGGYGDGTRTEQFQDLWQWDGQRWTEVLMVGPTPGIRLGHAMAFDRARGRLVLFGGFGPGSVMMGDTWEWDGTSWTNITRPTRLAH